MYIYIFLTNRFLFSFAFFFEILFAVIWFFFSQPTTNQNITIFQVVVIFLYLWKTIISLSHQ